MKDGKLTEMLSHFRHTTEQPVLNSDVERKKFWELQRYNFIRVNSNGEWVITSIGKEALEMGIKEYLKSERFENQLAREAPKLKKQNRILIFLTIILFILLVFLLIELNGFSYIQ